MINLELKVYAPHIGEIKKKAVEIGAVAKGEILQTDTYFLIGKRRFKFREERDTNYLVYYIRSDTENSKLSSYYIIHVPRLLKKIIKYIFSFSLGIKVVVNKKRDLFIYKDTRIHFDDVDRLGTYVELETVFNKNNTNRNLAQEHNYVIEHLGLQDFKRVSNSYSDLLLNRPN